jgi:Alginate lyase
VFRPCRFPKRFAHGVGSLCLAVIITIIAVVPASARRTPVGPAFWHPNRAITASQSSRLFFPIVYRAREPIGIIIQPAELLPTKAQFDQRIEPGRSAVKSLLSNAAEALAGTPCAVANYTTTTGYACLNSSSENAYLLAIAYRITFDSRYSEKAAEYVRIWPAALIGIDPSDEQSQLDWSRLVPALIWGADLLAGAPGWGEADRLQLIAMLQKYALKQAKAAAQRNNNWADAGNLLWLSIAIYANLPSERVAAVNNWKLKLNGVLQSNGTWLYGMLPDGSIAEEDRRGAGGLSYNQTALSIKTVFAEVLRRRGDASLYSYKTPRGVGLKNGWDFLSLKIVDAYAGRCTWPYTADHCVDPANRSGWELAYAYWRSSAYLPVILEHRPYQWSDWSDPGYSTVLFANLSLSGS